jgi:dolichol kinase
LLANRNRLLQIADESSSVTDSPEEKPLRATSFIVHVTRGLIRDHNMRRKAMFVLVLIALLLLFGGSTFLQPLLNPREHRGWFIFYWFICAWLTLTAMLLALFDLLLTRAHSRKAKSLLRGELSETQSRDSGRSTTGE